MRAELNLIDAMGFDDPAAPGMVAQLRDHPLPDKMPDNYNPHSSSHSYSGSFQFPTDFQSNFPFNPAFDAHKLDDVDEQEIEFARSQFGRDFSGTSQDVYKDKPHLYTPDPYETPQHYAVAAAPPPAPSYYQPPAYHEPEPYQPPAYHEPSYSPPAYHETKPDYGYHEPEPYHEPEAYHPPVESYGPPPADSYGPPDHYKPKGPVMLKERPYQPKDIKPVTITTHDTYTTFDCRSVPYPDRHYADAEAGCSVSFEFYRASFEMRNIH